MRIIFKYSLLEELKNLGDLVKNHRDYTRQKSLYIEYPSLGACITLKLCERLTCYILRNLWAKRPSFDKALEELGLETDIKHLTCYLHTFGCGGWFDIDKNEVHVRWDYHGNRFIDTLVHEILHLITYDEVHDYSQREEVVKKYMDSSEIQKVLKN